MLTFSALLKSISHFAKHTLLVSGSRNNIRQKRRSYGAVQHREAAGSRSLRCPLKSWTPPSSHTLLLAFSSVCRSRFVPSGPHLGAFNLFPGFLRWSRPWARQKMCPCCWLLETFVQLVVTAAPFHCLTSLVGELLFLLHIFLLLIFLLCQISEVSDYVSIKDILCPAINVLIAAEKENPLGAVNNGLLFIRGHSSEVGQPAILLSFHSDDNIFREAGGGLASVNLANNKSTSQTSPRRDVWSRDFCPLRLSFLRLVGLTGVFTALRQNHHVLVQRVIFLKSSGFHLHGWNINLINPLQVFDITARTLFFSLPQIYL